MRVTSIITPLTIRSVSEHAGSSKDANCIAKDALHLLLEGRRAVEGHRVEPCGILTPKFEYTLTPDGVLLDR